jgi:hypothetical protein
MIGAASLTQGESDALIAMTKTFASADAVAIPPGVDDTRDLLGADPRERFLLDIWRSTFRLSKVRLQTRGRQIVVLVRLDIDGAPHTNPDGTRLAGTHLHLYREGYEDKWAQPLDLTRFRDVANPRLAFEDFCGFCNITAIPPFQASLL